MVIFGLVVVFIAIIVFQVPTLIKRQLWWDLASFSVLMIVGMALSFGHVLNLPIPNPIKIIDVIFTPLTLYLDNLLG